MNLLAEVLGEKEVKRLSRIDAKLGYWHPRVVEALIERARGALQADFETAMEVLALLEEAGIADEYLADLAENGRAKAVARAIPDFWAEGGVLGLGRELRARVSELSAVRAQLVGLRERRAADAVVRELEAMDRGSPEAALRVARAIVVRHPGRRDARPLPDTPLIRAVAAALPGSVGVDAADDLWVLACFQWVGDDTTAGAPPFALLERASALGSLVATRWLVVLCPTGNTELRDAVSERLALLGDPTAAMERAEEFRGQASQRARLSGWYAVAARGPGKGATVVEDEPPRDDARGGVDLGPAIARRANRLASEALFHCLAMHQLGLAPRADDEVRELLALVPHARNPLAFGGAHVHDLTPFDTLVKGYGLRSVDGLLRELRRGVGA